MKPFEAADMVGFSSNAWRDGPGRLSRFVVTTLSPQSSSCPVRAFVPA